MEVKRIVRIWLFIGVVMLFIQILVGGITRLTGSGLSITKWEIVTGTVPPLSEASWKEAFDLYKATPQYALINEGMSISDFKFIYFWEYIHRFWARLMGFVFLIPFLLFYFKGWIRKELLKDLGVVILLAMLAASFGWIMVASGLVHRPWVNAYKLTIHLCIGFSVYAALLWGFWKTGPSRYIEGIGSIKKMAKWFTAVVSIQIFLGGIMSGMKAGLFYPTWPDMNGEWIPAELLSATNWSLQNLVDYDKAVFAPALTQLLHRSTAYGLLVFFVFYIRSARASVAWPHIKQSVYILAMALAMQVVLGIWTLISCKGSIPVGLGSAHQIGGLLLLSCALYINFLLRKPKDFRLRST